jgi:hypothetical protein
VKLSTPLTEPSTLLGKLEQMRDRLRGSRMTLPGDPCHDTQVHVAGLFLRLHIEEIIEAVRGKGE